MYWNYEIIYDYYGELKININMRCIEMEDPKGSFLSGSRLTLTWDVLKYMEDFITILSVGRLTLTWDVLKLF